MTGKSTHEPSNSSSLIDLLEAAAFRALPAFEQSMVTDAGQPVACGIAVADGDVCGFFDIVTHSRMRRKGHGANLMSGLAEWGREQKAALFYLQVVGSNYAARALYRKLNFQDAYTYWYRTPNGTEGV